MQQIDKYKVQIDNTNEDKNEFVSCIVLDKNGRPLRLERSSKLKLDAGKYDFCSGHVKKNGEVAMQAIIRELNEELQFEQKDVQEIYRLGDIKTPHPLLKDTITHIYCLVTQLSENEINEKLQRQENGEIHQGEFLESIDELKNQISNLNSNWRVVMTEELQEKLDLLKTVIKERSIKNIRKGRSL